MTLLCPLLLWEVVICERSLAEPGTEECPELGGPPEKKDYIGQKKGKNSMEKAGFDQNGDLFFSPWLLSWIRWGC